MKHHFLKTHTALLKAFCVLAVLALSVTGAYPAEADTGKALILYYSRTGNTRMCCEVLQQALDADMVEIKDLNSRTSTLGIIGGMLKTLLGMHTAIEPATVDITPYDLIVVASPIWASKVTPAIRTFIDTNRFDGKNVALFTTSDVFLEEKYQNSNSELLKKAGAAVAGYFQVRVMDLVEKEKVPRDKEQILQDARAEALRMQQAAGAAARGH